MAREVGAEVLAWFAFLEVTGQQSFESCWNLGGRNTITNGATDGGMFAYGSAYTEVKGVHHFSFVFDLLAFQANVSDPVLAAAVGAAGYMQLELLVEAGQTFFELLNEPPREALGLANGKLAELGAGAGNCPAPEGRALDMQSYLFELACQFSGFSLRNIDEEQILHDRRTELAVAEAFSKLRGRGELISRKTSPQNRRSDVAQARLPLRVNADVVAQNVFGSDFARSRIEPVPDASLDLLEKALGGPILAREEMLQARPVTALTESLLVSEDACDRAGNVDNFSVAG